MHFYHMAQRPKTVSFHVSGGCSHSSATWAELGWAPGSNRFGQRWAARAALATEDGDCELAPVRSQGLNRRQVESVLSEVVRNGQIGRRFVTVLLARLRHPDAVFFLNMTPVTALSGGISPDLLDQNSARFVTSDTNRHDLCRTYC